MPRTRLTATTQYTAPNTGHQLSPTRSIHAKRDNHFCDSSGGR
jgi:hypothetical protein